MEKKFLVDKRIKSEEIQGNTKIEIFYLLSILNSLADQGCTHVELSGSFYDYDSQELSIEGLSFRVETDKEYKERFKLEERAKEAYQAFVEKQEREALAKLKAKYEQ